MRRPSHCLAFCMELSSDLLGAATVGVITETNAEKAIDELKAYEAESATVLRGGRLSIVPAAELVPGDIVEVAGKITCGV